MHKLFLPFLFVGAAGLTGCSSSTTQSDSQSSIKAGHSRDYTSSYLAAKRGGAALRDAGYQQVYASAAKVRYAPQPDHPAAPSAQHDLADQPASVLDAMDDAVAKSIALPELDKIQTTPTVAVIPTAKPVDAKSLATNAAPRKTQRVHRRPSPKVNCIQPTADSNTADKPKPDA